MKRERFGGCGENTGRIQINTAQERFVVARSDRWQPKLLQFLKQRTVEHVLLGGIKPRINLMGERHRKTYDFHLPLEMDSHAGLAMPQCLYESFGVDR